MYKRTEVLGNIHQKTLSYIEDEKLKKSYVIYRKEFQNAESFKKIYPYPIHVDIEIDNFCNFACTFCPIGQPNNEMNKFYKTSYNLEENKIFELLDELKKLELNLYNNILNTTTTSIYYKSSSCYI